MNVIESPRSKQEKSPGIQIASGESFKISPSYETEPESHYQNVVLETIPIKIDSIKGEILLIKPELSDGNGFLFLTTDTEQVMIQLRMDNVPKNKIPSISCLIAWENKSFVGEIYFDEVEVSRSGSSEVNIEFFKPSTNPDVDGLLMFRKETIPQLTFTITTKKSV